MSDGRDNSGGRILHALHDERYSAVQCRGCK
jgi:hypothetical protein